MDINITFFHSVSKKNIKTYYHVPAEQAALMVPTENNYVTIDSTAYKFVQSNHVIFENSLLGGQTVHVYVFVRPVTENDVFLMR